MQGYPDDKRCEKYLVYFYKSLDMGIFARKESRVVRCGRRRKHRGRCAMYPKKARRME